MNISIRILKVYGNRFQVVSVNNENCRFAWYHEPVKRLFFRCECHEFISKIDIQLCEQEHQFEH